jgi:hypothetical protein
VLSADNAAGHSSTSPLQPQHKRQYIYWLKKRIGYCNGILIIKLSTMIKLAASSGTVIYEAGNKLYICKRPATWTSVFLFVTGLLAFILLVNGVLQLVVFKDQAGSSKIGIILILIAVFFTIVFWRVRVYQKKVSAIPLHELKITGIFDFESNNLLDGEQNILTPIDQVWLLRKMQVGSSSPELLIRWNGGSLSIVKGNPFSGGIAGIEKVLLSRGIRRK